MSVGGGVSSLLMAVPDKAKKPYKELNLAEKVSLIRMSESRPAMSQAELARVFGIAKSNVCRVLKRRTEYMSVWRSEAFSGQRKRKLRDSETRELNLLLAAWLRSRLLEGQPVSGPLLQDKARQLAPLLNLHNFSASNGWLQSFQKSYAAHSASLPPPKTHPPKDENNNEPSPPGNETLRAHMLKQHQITRMFMCRCCNWAFPDKTSLHIHMQAMATGSPGNVSVIAKSSTDAEPGSALIAEGLEFPDPADADDDAPASLVPRPRPHPHHPDAADTDSPGIDIESWMANNYPQVDASGVGSLGGNLCLTEEEDEEEGEDGAEMICEDAMDESSGSLPRGEEERADSGYDDDRIDEEAGAPKEEKPDVRPSPLNSLLYRAKMRVGAKRGIDALFPGVADEPVPAFLKREESPSNTSASSCHPSPPNNGDLSHSDAHASHSADGVCFNCRLLRGKLVFAENRNRFLEGKVANLELKASRLETRVVTSDASTKRHESDSKTLRDNNERLQQKLLVAQEKAVSFMQKGFGDAGATQTFLNDLLNSTYLGHTDAQH